MSRLALIALLVAVLGAAGLAAWILVPGPRPETEAATTASKPLSEAERRAHREKFFGGNTERDLRGGQEMKPRW